MKKTLLVVITTLAVLFALTATAERRIWLYSSDGNHVSLPVTKLDSISFEEPGRLVLNPEKKSLDCSGGRFSLSIQANKAWTATVSDPTALTISKASGTGSDNISVLAQSNADEKSYTSFVKFTLSDGTCSYLYVTVDGIVKSVSLDKSNMNIKVGGSGYLTATTDPAGSQITWSSSNNDVATVSNGVVKAVSEGKAVITAKSGSKSAECTVNVYSTKIPIPDVQGEAGKYTIAFRAPETACINDIDICLFGDFQGNDPKDETAPIATKIEQAGFDNWYKIVFESEDASQAKGKICPIAIDGTRGWDWQAYSYELLKGDAQIIDEYGTQNGIVCGEESLGDVIYVDVPAWASDPCVAPFPGGTVSFKVTVKTAFPEYMSPTDIRIAVAHAPSWTAGELPLEYNLITSKPGALVFEGTGELTAWEYKLNISYKEGEWIWETGDYNRVVPYNGIVNDEVAKWESSPWNPIPGGTGKFTITFSEGCNMAQYEKVIFTGNFAEEPWSESQREMTKVADNIYSWTGEFPESFQYKVIGRTEGAEDAWFGPGDNWKFDGETFKQYWYCERGWEKCKASDYPQVTIGTQTWMAENYRCSKYDTESEAYKEGRYTVPTSEDYTFTPYYTDASDKSKWGSAEYAGNLTEAQVAKLGYLYNWAAAVGVADGQKQTTAFSGNRQGICPNGWHIPTRAEWQTLVNYIEKTDGKGTNTASKHLKTTSGWYSGDSSYKPGLDTYGFAALPAGYADGSRVNIVGVSTYFWTATPNESDSYYAYSRYLYYNNDYLYDTIYGKDIGSSVRCLRD